jgi:chromosome segregation ATPase
LETRKKELSVIEERINQSSAKMSEIMNTLNLLEHKDEQALADLGKDTQQLIKTHEKYVNEINSIQEEKKKLEDKNAELQIQLSELTNKADKARVFESDMISKIEKRRDELVKLDRELEDKKAKSRKDVEDLTFQVETLKRELVELESRKNESLGAIAKTDEMQVVLNRLRAEKEKLIKEITDKNKELEKIKIFIARLKEKELTQGDVKRKDQISF